LTEHSYDDDDILAPARAAQVPYTVLLSSGLRLKAPRDRSFSQYSTSQVPVPEQYPSLKYECQYLDIKYQYKYRVLQSCFRPLLGALGLGLGLGNGRLDHVISGLSSMSVWDGIGLNLIFRPYVSSLFSIPRCLNVLQQLRSTGGFICVDVLGSWSLSWS